MTLQAFLNYTLFQTENKEFDLKVYEVLFIFLILLITYIIIGIFKRIFQKRVMKKAIDVGRSHTMLQIIKYFLWIGAVFLSFEAIGLKITLIWAGSAALLVGLGLGLQQIFQDVMSGIAILIEGIIKIDDIVEIQEGIVGRVVEISLRTSKIETRDNIVMIIPNSKFVTDNVINWSHMEKKTRFFINVGVAYGSDVDKVTHILLQCADKHHNVSEAPKPFVRFKDFGESSLDFQLFFWTTETFIAENIKSEIRYKIDAAFRENGVQIPFPQRDVHLKNS
jgi:small-conductance mechanosensitive channel